MAVQRPARPYQEAFHDISMLRSERCAPGPAGCVAARGTTVPTVAETTITDRDGLRRLLAPRDDLVAEQPAVANRDGTPRFALAEGPFDRWQRTVTAVPVNADDQDRDEAALRVTESINFRLALPGWRLLFTPIVRRAVFQSADRRRSAWWATPDRLDADTARSLARLCLLSAAAGYLGTLLTQTNTFAKAEFGTTDTALATMLAAVRLAALLALVVVAIADRRGRRTVLMWSAAAACVLAATGAFTPDLVWLGISQTAARTASTALAIVLGIFAIEEVPAGSRAFSVSVLAMSAALGAGVCVAALPLADLGEGAWRLLYVLPLVFLPGVARASRRLPETRRFLAVGPADAAASHVAPANRESRRAHRRRFALLASSALLVSLFVTPASQLLNEFLRSERGFSALGITMFTLLTNTPGGIGVVVGGRLADLRGRRLVGAVAIGGGVGFTVAMFFAAGPWIWLWSLFGALVGAAAVPALGVYGPELFPTASRGSANGGLNLAGVLGAAIGLVLAGVLADHFGSLPPAMAVLAIGPAVVTLLIVFAYPETAHRELEELNPEDARPGTGAAPPDGTLPARDPLA
jgi:MFS family permease